jgi:hypothetical protein
MSWRDSQHGVTEHLGVSKQLKEIHKMSDFDENFWFGGTGFPKAWELLVVEAEGSWLRGLETPWNPKQGTPLAIFSKKLTCEFLQWVLCYKNFGLSGKKSYVFLRGITKEWSFEITFILPISSLASVTSTIVPAFA